MRGLVNGSWRSKLQDRRGGLSAAVAARNCRRLVSRHRIPRGRRGSTSIAPDRGTQQLSWRRGSATHLTHGAVYNRKSRDSLASAHMTEPAMVTAIRDRCLGQAIGWHRNFMQRCDPRAKNQAAGLVPVDATQEDQYHLLPKAWASLGEAMRRRSRRQDFRAPLYIGLGLARFQLRVQGQQVPPVLLQSKYLRPGQRDISTTSRSLYSQPAGSSMPA
jgi:hypothetical protein